MAVKITYFPKNSFFKTLFMYFIGVSNKSESLAVGATGTAVTVDTLAHIFNNEIVPVIGAHGKNPDATLNTGTYPQSTSGYAIPVGQIIPVSLKAGDKINIKTFA